MLITGSTYELLPFAVQVNVDADLVTTITYPAGTAYSSHTLTAGTFDGTTWSILGYTTGVIRYLTITVEITDIGLFSALAPEDRVVTGSTDVLVGEVVTANNTTTKSIDDSTCLDLLWCSMAELNEYDSMSDAVAALGDGKPFLASLLNIEGWSYRALIVTPFS